MKPFESTARGQDSGFKDFQIGYSPALDGLRGVAILAVMAFNGHFALVRGGFLGVDMFFALSGFLITCVLVQGYAKTSSISLKNFYFRRALRLLPALFALMLACAAYALLLQPGDKAAMTLKGILYTLLYVANWAQAPPFPPGIGPLSHAWSLSVEEQFYIIWPLLLLVLLKLRSRSLTLVILCGFIVISVIINILLWNAGTPHLRMYFGSDTRAHQLLIGCTAALLLSWSTLRSTKGLRLTIHAASALSCLGILLSFYLARVNGAFVYNGGFGLLSLATTILIVDLLLFPSLFSRIVEFGPLVWIGKISYGLYLWHYPIFEASRRLFEERTTPAFYQATGLVTTFAVATASFYFLEQPFLKLRRHFSDRTVTADLAAIPRRPAESV